MVPSLIKSTFLLIALIGNLLRNSSLKSAADAQAVRQKFDEPYGYFIESCPPFEMIVSSVQDLFEDFNTSSLLSPIKCNNPLSLVEKVSTKKLLSGNGNVIMASSSSLFSLLLPDKLSLSSILRIDLINLNDHLLLYQKSVTPNFASQLLTDIFVEWGWRHANFYLDDYYADDFLSNVEEFDQQKEYHSQVAQVSLATKQTPAQFVERLADENSYGIRTIVIIANLSVTLKILQLAYPTELFSGRQQWLIFSNEDLNEFQNEVQLKSDTQFYIARRNNIFKELNSLIIEYLKMKPPFISLFSNSSLMFSMDSLESENTWRTVVTSTLSLEIRKLHLISETNLTSSAIAYWTPLKRLVKVPEPPFPNYHLRNLLVATMESPPYVIIESDSVNRSNLSYSGYMVDVLQVVSSVLNFSIEYLEVDISRVNPYTNLSMNGVVETLARREADIGLLDLAITGARMQEIDFAEVALDVQATAGLYRRQGAEGDGMDKFGVYLEPFHLHVWIASIVTVILLVGSLYASLKITEKFTKSSSIKWENDRMDTSRSFLLGFQAVAQQGSELEFGNPSARIFFVILWFFALIAYSSYSATLMSYLTFSKISAPFSNLASLAKNKDYGIGILDGSSQLELFRESRSPVYNAIWKRILNDKKSVVLYSVEQSFKKATKEKFVYLSDDKIMKYWTRNTCDLVVSDPLTSPHLVTMTFQKNSPHRKAISRVLRMMNDGGLLYRLRDKWWGTALICKTETQAFISLSLMNVATGFLLLAGGIVGGTLGLMLEWLIFRAGKSGKSQGPKTIEIENIPKRTLRRFNNRLVNLAYVPDENLHENSKLASGTLAYRSTTNATIHPTLF